MKVREITQLVLHHWPLGALALAVALAFGFAGQDTSPVAAQAATVQSPVTTQIHFPNHTPLPCFSAGCPVSHHAVGPSGSKVHDQATVTSANLSLNPTGTVRFVFHTNAHCQGTPSTSEVVAVSASGGVGVAESSSTGPLAAGEYAYRALYSPDAAAKALGFGNSSGPCGQLRIIKVKSGTEIHFSDHTKVPCFSTGCFGQTAPAGAVVHDLDTVDSGDVTRTPTGTVRFSFYDDDLHCRTVPASNENVVVSVVSGAVTKAESSNTAPLAAGEYSYKAVYSPDAAAVAKGLGSSHANCEQLLVTAAPVP